MPLIQVEVAKAEPPVNAAAHCFTSSYQPMNMAGFLKWLPKVISFHHPVTDLLCTTKLIEEAKKGNFGSKNGNLRMSISKCCHKTFGDWWKTTTLYKYGSFVTDILSTASAKPKEWTWPSTSHYTLSTGKVSSSDLFSTSDLFHFFTSNHLIDYTQQQNRMTDNRVRSLQRATSLPAG